MKKWLCLSLVFLACTGEDDPETNPPAAKACGSEWVMDKDAMKEFYADPRFYKGAPAPTRCGGSPIAIGLKNKDLRGLKADISIYDSTCSKVYSESGKKLDSASSEANSFFFWNGLNREGKALGTGVYHAEIVYPQGAGKDTALFTFGIAVEDSCIIK